MSIKEHLFSVYDEKADAFTQCFQMKTKGLAIRAIQDLLDDENHQFSKHCTEFVLYQLAEYDLNTGEVLPNLTPVGRLSELKKE